MLALSETEIVKIRSCKITRFTFPNALSSKYQKKFFGIHPKVDRERKKREKKEKLYKEMK